MSATILIVEDEESIQELLSYNFEAEGFAVRALDGSEDVVREVLADKPDLIRARLDAAKHVRHRDLPVPARPVRDTRCAHHHAHRAW
jgi:DNA-binding NtrC family response regulator